MSTSTDKLRAKRKWSPALSAALAAAAAAALLIGLRGSNTELGLESTDAVPGYELALVGGDRPTRAEPAPSEAPSTVVLGPGSSLEIVLRPATPDPKPIGVRGFLIQNEQARPWEVKAEVSPDGAVRIAGERETLFANVPAGPWEMAVAIGRPEALPDAEAAVRGTPGDKDARVRTFRRKIVLTDEGPARP
ncbi:hypothetical protein [Polyangium aurulentum]|uniref:hypothetical protein n=1 Tax=Polyangium aurulentum TaxID=2567896 RepID=UPI0010ADB6F7|nr:hypothetical protein [Polyangium aurulentum]UQA58663.1 hypothetical protein E8A73_046750 [Polyangium aurulentum]